MFKASVWLTAYLLNAIVHGQQRLHPPALEHVGELHVDRLHWASVAQDPVLVWVRSIVVARRSLGGGKKEEENNELQMINY